MLIVFIFFLFILGFSLYQYIENAEWEALRNTCQRIIYANRNKKYGAYHQRNRESTLLMYVLIGVISAAVLAIYTKTIVDNYDGSNTLVFSEVSDTTTFSLNNQNVEETPPSQFNFNGDNGDGMPQARDGQTNPSDTDNPEAAASKERTQEASKQPKNSEQSIYDFEKELYAKEGGAAEREKIQKEMEKRQKEREEKKKQQQKIDGGQGGNVGSNTGTKGKNLAEYNINGRKAYQGNDDFIKIPGYMCGKGISEKIVVKVRVNSNGDVFDAKSLAPAGANPCCVEQAINYAKKSRFEYSSKPIEEGTITYYFKPQ